jgi:hypothetical protein
MNDAILPRLTGVLFVVTPIAFNASRQAGYESRKSGGERP